MTIFGASDLPALLADFGVPIVWGSVTGQGIADQVDRELLQDPSIALTGREVTVTLETSKFGTLKKGNQITVDGITQLVLRVHRVGDGAFTEVICRPA